MGDCCRNADVWRVPPQIRGMRRAPFGRTMRQIARWCSWRHQERHYIARMNGALA